jgi:hypothetical protein
MKTAASACQLHRNDSSPAMFASYVACWSKVVVGSAMLFAGSAYKKNEPRQQPPNQTLCTRLLPCCTI